MIASPVIALLQPPGLCRAFTRSKSSLPPLGLAQLSAVINNPLRCRVIDADGWGWNESETLYHLQSFSAAPKAVGMSVTTGTTKIIQHWASLVKSYLPATTVIIGGPHASLDPLDTIAKCPSIDFIVRGEGEPIFADIVERLENEREIDSISELPGVIDVRYSPPTSKEEILGVEMLRVSDFSELPFPSMADLPFQNYQCPDVVTLPLMAMMTQRGCPMRCGFCSTPTLHGNKVRGWSTHRILDELERLYHVFGVRQVTFFDDVFTSSPKRTKEICQGIIDRNLQPLSWFGNARADMLNEEICRIAKAAGCHQLYLGFESGENRILKSINKGCNVARLEFGAHLMKKCGIDRSIGFVLGLPGENEESVQATIALAKRVKPERLQFTRWTPLAGSPLVENDKNYMKNVKSFHDLHDDQVGKWIDQCYEECQYDRRGWAKPTW